MSVKAIYWATQQQLPPLQKLALIMLADRHNKDTGRCDPSMDRLAKDCGMSKDSAKRAVKELCEKGLITAKERRRGSVCLPNYYRFNFGYKLAGPDGEDDHSDTEGVGANSTQGRCSQHPGVGAISTPNQEAFNQKAEPKELFEPKDQKLFRAESAKDDRHVSFRESCRRYAEHCGMVWVWDGSDAKQLALLLKAAPDLELEVFQQCLQHRARSEGVRNGDRPRAYLPTILQYQQGPLDGFGKVKGTSNAADQRSGFRSKTERNKQSFAEFEERLFGDRQAAHGDGRGSPSYTEHGSFAGLLEGLSSA